MEPENKKALEKLAKSNVRLLFGGAKEFYFGKEASRHYVIAPTDFEAYLGWNYSPPSALRRRKLPVCWPTKSAEEGVVGFMVSDRERCYFYDLYQKLEKLPDHKTLERVAVQEYMRYYYLG